MGVGCPFADKICGDLRDVEPEKIFDLAGEYNDGYSACEPYNDRVGNKFDEGAELGKAHDHEDDAGHDGGQH